MTSRALRGGACAARGTGDGLLSLGFGTASLRARSVASAHASLRCGPSILQMQTRSSHFGSVSGKSHPDGAMSAQVRGMASRCGGIGSGFGNSSMPRSYRDTTSTLAMTSKDCGRYGPGPELRNLRRYFSYKSRYLEREGKDGREQYVPRIQCQPSITLLILDWVRAEPYIMPAALSGKVSIFGSCS
jgi:hypothetical protein